MIIYGLALLLPVAFTPLTSEYYDTAKLILIGAAVLIMLLVWASRLLTENRLSIIKTPLDLGLVLFLVVAVISTILSPTPFVSVFGALPRVHGSLIFVAAIVLLYFMVATNIKSKSQVRTVLDLAIFSTMIAGLIGLASYFKLFLPFPFAQFTNFSLTGAPAVTALISAMLLPVVLSDLLRQASSRSYTAIYKFLALLVFALTIILVGTLASWVASLFAVGLTLYITKSVNLFRAKSMTGIILIAVAAVVAIVATLSYTPTLKDRTPFGKLASEFNRDVQLPFAISWKISAGAFRDSPILGTGPATYQYNFTQYKPIEYNQTELWDRRIFTAHNQFLQTWAEMGGAGVIILLIISISFVVLAFRHQSDQTEHWGLGLAGVTFIILMALSPMTVLTQALGFMLLALYMAASRGESAHEMSIDLSGTTASGRSTHFLVPLLIMLPVLVLVIGGFYYIGKLAVGEFYHRQALNAVAANKGLDAYNSLIAAEKVNPDVDLYRVDLSQINFALANNIAAQKGPSEASPGGSLTDADKQNIQQLIQQAIAEGRNAVVLSPRSAANWENLALIYRQISGVAENAVQFSLDSYGRAIQLDPLNPLLRLAVGGVYYQAKNYDLAIRFFDDAVSLKPDYPNALYNLAVALRDKGNTAEAQSVAERLVSQLQDKPDSVDYKTASQLLSDLKAKISTEKPPAAVPSAALERQDLPKVVDLPEPEKVSTPAAVKK